MLPSIPRICLLFTIYSSIYKVYRVLVCARTTARWEHFFPAQVQRFAIPRRGPAGTSWTPGVGDEGEVGVLPGALPQTPLYERRTTENTLVYTEK